MGKTLYTSMQTNCALTYVAKKCTTMYKNVHKRTQSTSQPNKEIKNGAIKAFFTKNDLVSNFLI